MAILLFSAFLFPFEKKKAQKEKKEIWPLWDFCHVERSLAETIRGKPKGKSRHNFFLSKFAWKIFLFVFHFVSRGAWFSFIIFGPSQILWFECSPPGSGRLGQKIIKENIPRPERKKRSALVVIKTLSFWWRLFFALTIRDRVVTLGQERSWFRRADLLFLYWKSHIIRPNIWSPFIIGAWRNFFEQSEAPDELWAIRC